MTHLHLVPSSNLGEWTAASTQATCGLGLCMALATRWATTDAGPLQVCEPHEQPASRWPVAPETRQRPRGFQSPGAP